MNLFVWATGDDMNMHAKFHIICKHRYLWIINSVSEFLEFCTKIYHVKVSLVKPTVKSGSRGFIQNLFCNFWTFLQVSTNFWSLKQFLKFETIEKHLKTIAQYWAETGPRLQPTGRGGQLRAVGQKAGWATAWQPSPAGQMACAARCNTRMPAWRQSGRERGNEGVAHGRGRVRQTACGGRKRSVGGSVLRGAAGRGPGEVDAAWRQSGRERGWERGPWAWHGSAWWSVVGAAVARPQRAATRQWRTAGSARRGRRGGQVGQGTTGAWSSAAGCGAVRRSVRRW
jgi:hypothetical protein